MDAFNPYRLGLPKTAAPVKPALNATGTVAAPPPKPAINATGTVAAPPPPKQPMLPTAPVPVFGLGLGQPGSTQTVQPAPGQTATTAATVPSKTSGPLTTGGAPPAIPDVDQDPTHGGLTYTPPPPGSNVAPGATGAPTYSTTNPLGENPMIGVSSAGGYERDQLDKFGGKTAIAPSGAYDIGPYYGYAFDAGGRVLDSGYNAAGALTGAANAASQLGVAGGQQVGAVAQDYAGTLAAAGQSAQLATQPYEDRLNVNTALAQQGAVAGQDIGLAGQTAATKAGNALTKQGGQFINQGAAAADQDIASINLRASQDAAARSGALANQLAGIGAEAGPSAAQAQLQSALNQSQQSNLAMARSGRGWGGSASAQTQALAANAAAGQQAANSSAMLRAQEEQQRMALSSQNVGNAAQLQTAGAQTALAQQQLAAQTNLQEAQQQAQQQQALYGLGLQSQQQGAELGVQGTNLALAGNQAYQQGLAGAGQMAAQGAATDLAGRQAYLAALGQGGTLATQGLQSGTELGLQGIGQGAGLYAQGQQMAQGAELTAMQFAAQQQQALAAQANAALQQYGVQKGVAIQQQQQTNQLIGTGISAAASMAGAGMMMSDRTAKTEIKPLGKDYALDFNPRAQELSDFGVSSAMNPQANTVENWAAAGALPANMTPPTGPSPNQQKAAQYLTSGLQNAGAGLQQNQGFNPILQQYLQTSDRTAKTDIQQLDEGEFRALQGISSAFGTPSTQELGAAQSNALAGLYSPAATAGVPLSQPNTAGLDAASAALDPVKAYSYEYKDPARHGAGPQYGIMAQELAKTPAGRTAVQPGPDGKLQVDTGRLAMITTAAQAQTQDRVDDVETKLAELRNMMRSRGMSVGAQ